MKEQIKQRIESLMYPILDQPIENLTLEDTEYFIQHMLINIQEAVHTWNILHK